MFRGQFNKQGFDRGAEWDNSKFASVKDTSSFTEEINMARSLIRLINDTALWMEDFRAPMNWLRRIVERLEVSEPLSLSREWIRSTREQLSVKEPLSLSRDWLRQFVERLEVSDLPDFAGRKFRSVAETWETSETLTPFRARFRSILDGKIIRDEEVKVGVKALWTLLATAITRLFFSGTAHTRQAVPCYLGGGERAVDLNIFKGNSKTFEVHVRNESLQNFNLNDCTIYFMVKNSVKDADNQAVLTKSSVDPTEIAITNEVGGLCEVYLVPGDTDQLPVKHYVYDIKVETDPGELYTVALGDFKLDHVVRRD